MALELADADGRNPHTCGQADRGAVNIVAGEGRASTHRRSWCSACRWLGVSGQRP